MCHAAMCRRSATVICCKLSIFYSLEKEKFKELKSAYPEDCKRFLDVAAQRRNADSDMVNSVSKSFRVYTENQEQEEEKQKRKNRQWENAKKIAKRLIS
ncbi:hypothetical protein CYMTET_21502 [Cymbomonas tetramitiformis]|uniref:Uncharacterized protein n=1 Tax=Cymbomonas tetramitiformis TaxID=36881 RepID=A0AAE0G1V3_9CHLO|nr:hypothetical protein CYMTET_21502 [Cymbomonas tetramitiformis]